MLESIKRFMFCLLTVFAVSMPCFAADTAGDFIDESSLEVKVLSLEELVGGLQNDVASIDQRLKKLESGKVGVSQPVPLSDYESSPVADYGSTGTAVVSTRTIPTAAYGTYSPPVSSGGSTGTVQFRSVAAPVVSAPVRSVSTRTRVTTQRQGVLGRIFNPQGQTSVQYASPSQVSTQVCVGPGCNLPN